MPLPQKTTLIHLQIRYPLTIHDYYTGYPQKIMGLCTIYPQFVHIFYQSEYYYDKKTITTTMISTTGKSPLQHR
jgi:hypothetical protein